MKEFKGLDHEHLPWIARGRGSISISTMNLLQWIKTSFALGLVMGISSQSLSADQAVALYPLPIKDEHDSKNPLICREVLLSSLAEGSPGWVYLKLMQASRRLDFTDLANYQSPCGVWEARQTPIRAMTALTNRRMAANDRMRIYDELTKIDGDRCCMYFGLELSGGGAWDTRFHLFMKVNGRWILVGASEWQSGKLDTVPNYEP